VRFSLRLIEARLESEGRNAMRHPPETILLAVLHKMKSGVRFADDDFFISTFGKAAERDPALFGVFRTDPVYGESPILQDLLTKLDAGNSIRHFNADLVRYQVSSSTTGAAGRKHFVKLSPLEQSAAEALAATLSEHYESQEAAC
jgi:hypothetical protein